jgi:hypothetical protein
MGARLMALCRVALVKDGVVENIVVIEDDPAQVHPYIRETGLYGDALLQHLAQEFDCIELHENEGCGPGSTIAAHAVESHSGLGVVRVQVDAEGLPVKPVVERFERAVLVVEEQPAQVL